MIFRWRKSPSRFPRHAPSAEAAWSREHFDRASQASAGRPTAPLQCSTTSEQRRCPGADSSLARQRQCAAPPVASSSRRTELPTCTCRYALAGATGSTRQADRCVVEIRQCSRVDRRIDLHVVAATKWPMPRGRLGYIDEVTRHGDGGDELWPPAVFGHLSPI